LTDTDAVEPDGRTTVDGDWLGRSEDLFAEVTAIPTGADGPDQQPGRDKHEQDEIDEVQQERRQLGLPRRGDSGRRSVETAGRRSGAPSPPYIAYEIDQPGELVLRIDVALDDVEDEVVEAAKAPDRDREQDRGLKRRAFNQKQRGSEQAEDEEEGAFDVEPGGAGDVPHWNSDFKTAIPNVLGRSATVPFDVGNSDCPLHFVDAESGGQSGCKCNAQVVPARLAFIQWLGLESVIERVNGGSQSALFFERQRDVEFGQLIERAG